MSNENNTVSAPIPTNPAKKGRFLGVFLACMLAVGTFLSGIQIGQLGVTPVNQAGLFSLFAADAPTTAGVDMGEFWRVWEILDNKFTKTSTSTLTKEQKIQGAIDGLVATYGDPYTVFLPKDDTIALTQDISGNFSGVGMEVGLRNNIITVIAPLPETPASKAGVVAGDIIVKIDATSTEGMRVDEAVRLIRGEKGTTVTLSIVRTGETEVKEISIVRDNIAVPTVTTEKVGKVFIIKLSSFNSIAEAKMQEALRDYTTSGATSLVLDLRGNPGGLLQSAVAIASYFVPTGKVVVREEFGQNDDKDKLYRSQGRVVREFTPKEFVVLVDNGSASAAEILAGALREHGLATLIGTPTFGKGSVQELVDLPSGASVKVTVARWLTPNGVSISEGGLKPDILIGRTPQQYLDGIDPQQTAATAFLKGEKVESETTNATSTTPSN